MWSNSGLKGDADRIAALHGKEFCGSCYGGEPAPGKNCCNTCEEVREAYARKGWSFADPAHIDVCIQEGWTEKIQAQNKEGCRITGKVHVNKVVGNFHLSPGRSFSRNNVHTHDILPYLKGTGEEHHDFSHTIHEFSFGAEDEYSLLSQSDSAKPMGKSVKQKLDIIDPLRGLKAQTKQSEYMYQYFTKVVATEYRTLAGSRSSTFQYSATTYERDLSPAALFGLPGSGGEKNKVHGDSGSTHQPHQVQHGYAGIPGVFFVSDSRGPHSMGSLRIVVLTSSPHALFAVQNYEIAPLRTVHTEYRMPFTRFLSSLCSIVGGVLTVAGLLDAAVWQWRIRQSAAGGAAGADMKRQSGLGTINGGYPGSPAASYGAYGRESYGMAGRSGKLI